MDRNGSLEYARFIAAVGIVFFHAGAPGAAVGYAALPFFLIVMLVLSAPAVRNASLASYAAGKAQRLLVPWVIWSGIYGSLKLAEIALTDTTARDEFLPHMLLTGPALHLWFLPFAFLACLALYPLLRGLPERPRPVLITVLTVVAAVLASTQAHLALPIPLAQWAHALPAVCLGAALALVGRDGTLIFLVISGFAVAALLAGNTPGFGQMGLALACFAACTIVKLPATPFAMQLGRLSLGVYLAHPIMISVLERGTPLAKGDLGLALGGVVGACVLAQGIEWALSPRSRRRALHFFRKREITKM